MKRYQFSQPFKSIDAFVKAVNKGDVLYHRTGKNRSDKLPQQWKILGIHTTKDSIKVCFRRGLSQFATLYGIDQINENLAAGYTYTVLSGNSTNV